MEADRGRLVHGGDTFLQLLLSPDGGTALVMAQGDGVFRIPLGEE